MRWVLIRIATECMITVLGDLLAYYIGKTRFGETRGRMFGNYFRSQKIRAIQESDNKPLIDYTLISMHGQMASPYRPSALRVDILHTIENQ